MFSRLAFKSLPKHHPLFNPQHVHWLKAIILCLFAPFALTSCYAQQASKQLPMQGESFALSGREAFLIPASLDRSNDQASSRDDASSQSNRPWVWYAPTLPNLPGPEERWMFERFQKAGIAIAGIDAGESYGSPKGNQIFDLLHAEMVRRGYSPKPILLGRSRGGLQTLSWAISHPSQVTAWAGIYPVCSLASYPGLDKAADVFDVSAQELQKRLKEWNPVDRIDVLANAKIPLFAIHGDVDTVVPLEANSGAVQKRYKQLDAPMELLVPPGQGHNMWEGFFQCKELVDFVINQAIGKTNKPEAESQSASQAKEQVFWIGGYGPGIYASRLKPDGSMVEPKLVAKQPKASFFALNPRKDVLYVVTESAIDDRQRAASLAAYRFDRAAYERGELPELSLINIERVQGNGPCHVTTDRQGRFAVVSNYGSGSVSLLPIREDGGLDPESSTIQHQGNGPNTARQEKPHAHCAQVDPTDQWVLVADLGVDRVFVYSLDAVSKQLKPSPHPSLALAGGSGPRHLSFHPDGKSLYIINELNMTLTSAAWDPQVGKLTEIRTGRTVAEDPLQAAWSTAEVLVHPSGRFVYGSNRGHNTIALFAINPKDYSATRIENFSTLGRTPRNFRMDPSGSFLLAENQDTDTVVAFRIDSATGFLKPTGHVISAEKPACIKFLEPPANR